MFTARGGRVITESSHHSSGEETRLVGRRPGRGTAPGSTILHATRDS